MIYTVFSHVQTQRVILGPRLCYCRVWPPDVHTIMVIELNTLLLHCYIVNMFFLCLDYTIVGPGHQMSVLLWLLN